ncbi:hypothetical protein AVEN_18161-1 [Araneus ventricosus]|uniref:PID domain-containing protein n=1 Tax=Araneus ventricosus TaxID=182803 RepID=A0A4Y2AK30_ARAVE|nr:hypothetical protein AVEN_18161-1 [Araneus ventricosus]
MVLNQTDLLSYANPNYQLTSSDENCNIEVGGSYDDIYEGLDVACKINRRLSIRGRRKYASLDPVSMGVDVDLETVPMLTTNAENNLHCGFIVHTAQDEFVAHVFYCEPSSGALCKTIEAACKLRYQKCLDAHRQDSDSKNLEAQRKGLRTALKSVFGTFFMARQRRSAET